jgi:hypothetical protein
VTQQALRVGYMVPLPIRPGGADAARYRTDPEEEERLARRNAHLMPEQGAAPLAVAAMFPDLHLCPHCGAPRTPIRGRTQLRTTCGSAGCRAEQRRTAARAAAERRPRPCLVCRDRKAYPPRATCGEKRCQTEASVAGLKRHWAAKRAAAG